MRGMRKPPLICATLVSRCYHLLVSHMPVPEQEAFFLKHNHSASRGSTWEEEASLMQMLCLWQGTWERLRKFTWIMPALQFILLFLFTVPAFSVSHPPWCPPVPHRGMLMPCGGVPRLPALPPRVVDDWSACWRYPPGPDYCLAKMRVKGKLCEWISHWGWVLMILKITVAIQSELRFCFRAAQLIMQSEESIKNIVFCIAADILHNNKQRDIKAVTSISMIPSCKPCQQYCII